MGATMPVDSFSKSSAFTRDDFLDRIGSIGIIGSIGSIGIKRQHLVALLLHTMRQEKGLSLPLSLQQPGSCLRKRSDGLCHGQTGWSDVHLFSSDFRVPVSCIGKGGRVCCMQYRVFCTYTLLLYTPLSKMTKAAKADKAEQL